MYIVWFQSVLTIIGFLISIYLSKNSIHKVIRYYIAKGKDDYIVVLWNASKATIMKDDIKELYVVTPAGSSVKTAYSSDDIKLNVDSVYLYYDSKDLKKTNLSFDFLCPNTGFIVQVDGKDVTNNKINFAGRLFGEDKFSVRYSESLYTDTKGKVMTFMDKPVNWLVGFYSVFLIFMGLGLLIIGKNARNLVLGTVFIALAVYGLFDIYKQVHVPFWLKHERKKMFKKHRIIKDKNQLQDLSLHL